MSDFTTFLTKYAGEASKVAAALGSIISGIALPAAEKAKVLDTIDALETAANSILSGIKGVTDPTAVKINKTDLEAAVVDTLKSMGISKEDMQAMINNAVVAALVDEKTWDEGA